jgi:hypothetical protein
MVRISPENESGETIASLHLEKLNPGKDFFCIHDWFSWYVSIRKLEEMAERPSLFLILPKTVRGSASRCTPPDCFREVGQGTYSPRIYSWGIELEEAQLKPASEKTHFSPRIYSWELESRTTPFATPDAGAPERSGIRSCEASHRQRPLQIII